MSIQRPGSYAANSNGTSDNGWCVLFQTDKNSVREISADARQTLFSRIGYDIKFISIELFVIFYSTNKLLKWNCLKLVFKSVRCWCPNSYIRMRYVSAVNVNDYLLSFKILHTTKHQEGCSLVFSNSHMYEW